MTIEYAIQEKTFVDGPFDRIQTGRGSYPEVKYTLEEVEGYVSRQNSRYGKVIARVVSREVSDWTPVP